MNAIHIDNPTTPREVVFNALMAAERDIIKLQKGLPIAQSKAHTMSARAKVTQQYNADIRAAKARHDEIYAVYAAMPADTK